MAFKKRLIKTGDRTLIVDSDSNVSEVRNRIPSEEAVFAVGLIEKWAMGQDSLAMKPEQAVERAFYVAHLTFKHIREKRMDTPFPFAKVFGDAEKND